MSSAELFKEMEGFGTKPVDPEAQSAIERFLAERELIKCAPKRARLTPAQCAARQERDDRCAASGCPRNGKSLEEHKADGEYTCIGQGCRRRTLNPNTRCGKCKEKVEAPVFVDEDEKAPQIESKNEKKPEMGGTEMAKQNKRATCEKCKRPDMVIIGRGLCGKCYYAEKRKGTLDANWPRLRPSGKDFDKSPPPEEPALETPPPEEPDEGHPALPPALLEPTAEVLEYQPVDFGTIESADAITLRFTDTPRDRELLAHLAADARENRRSVEGQALTILEEYFTSNHPEEETP